ncbi:hypothetical protein AUEXF2481DRAFT_116296 [Aureobasidium subglaciale EXF-2481]|uniref:Uncharacterized protein n=1 Tax=Aureobasidium subglaciale (strain EXF-2481) TaxID=1043005 RepID=A0A074YQX6_AURSE|nr:uncharacterized protein AUEXF2481DRAFT_116296 [Aureobasidium subglaciale EXF-2481]KAI5208044.1 hypothetical protein E4T38_02998 [Aureobasidium subglaciale]KAI5226867.1 hypothetical protein E4T40_02772 [Aureobasidium subglaciale]KAI5230220.1 hypothetical protein E4T41_02995 [Aureobasidium subglaciale]KAI5264643.1 hypothetical protein E4T46_02773 [Aureobasidium subglaciale]KER00076.1 hypothetical protein AUEXF2481DRAFT_116296 [Aureobasidium subglaciale EXF-2481]
MDTAESLENDRQTTRKSKSNATNNEDELAEDDNTEKKDKTKDDKKYAKDEKAQNRQRFKSRQSPLVQHVLISRLAQNCSVIGKPSTEIMLEQLEDVLTRFGSCLIEQFRVSDFLPTNMFQMNDIVEVGGAELKLRNGRRFIPNTQIRFLGSYYPAIIIRVVRTKTYAKVVEETKHALHCMEGKLRFAIIIKIDKAHKSASEQLEVHSDEDSGQAAKQKNKRLSLEDRVTVKILHLVPTEKLTRLFIDMEEEVFPRATEKIFAFDWQDISPNPWIGPAPMPQIRLSLAPLSQLAYRFMEDEPALVGRPLNLDHVNFDDTQHQDLYQDNIPQQFYQSMLPQAVQEAVAVPHETVKRQLQEQ